MQITPGLRGVAIFEPSARLGTDRNPISDGGGGEGSAIGLKCLERRWFGRCLVVTAVSDPPREIARPGAFVQRGSAPIFNTAKASIGLAHCNGESPQKCKMLPWLNISIQQEYGIAPRGKAAWMEKRSQQKRQRGSGLMEWPFYIFSRWQTTLWHHKGRLSPKVRNGKRSEERLMQPWFIQFWGPVQGTPGAPPSGCIFIFM